MKFKIILLIVIGISFSAKCQSFRGISMGANYSPQMGINMEVTATTTLKKKILLNLRAGSNFDNTISFRGGLSYKLFDKVIMPTIGVEYSYEKIFKPLPELDKISVNLEFPIQIGVKVTSHYNIFGGIVPYYNIKGSQFDKHIINCIRLGLQYNF